MYIYLNLNPRNTGILAALGPVVPGILRSCFGYAGFWPWLLAAALRRQGNGKNARRSSIYAFLLFEPGSAVQGSASGPRTGLAVLGPPGNPGGCGSAV